MKAVLTIAGSDSSGCAGVQADLRTFAALAIHGASAITAVTAQTSRDVRSVHEVPQDVLRAQIEAAFDELEVRAVKTGMLCSAAQVEVVASCLRARARGVPLVVDPVISATSGGRLAADGAVAALVELLFPMASLVTPNVPELQQLTGAGAAPPDLEAMGRALVVRGAPAVLAKGGHLDGDPVDVLIEAGRLTRFAGQRIEGRGTRGTGCTYASAIAVHLARGAGLAGAVQAAHDFVARSIRAAPAGGGPVDQIRAWNSSGGVGGGEP